MVSEIATNLYIHRKLNKVDLVLYVWTCVKACARPAQRMWVSHLRSGLRSLQGCPPAPCEQRCTSPLQSCPSAAARTSAIRDYICFVFHKELTENKTHIMHFIYNAKIEKNLPGFQSQMSHCLAFPVQLWSCGRETDILGTVWALCGQHGWRRNLNEALHARLGVFTFVGQSNRPESWSGWVWAAGGRNAEFLFKNTILDWTFKPIRKLCANLLIL